MSQDAGDWVLVTIDQKLARKQGVPSRIPIPKSEFEKLADEGMSVEKMREWVGKFVATSPAMHNAAWRTENVALARSFEVFIAKKDGWAKAQQAFQRKDVKSAIGALRLLSNVDREDHCARFNLATALASAGDHAAALKLLDEIRDTWVDDADYHVTRARVLLGLDRRDEAIDALADALERDPACQAALDTLKALGVLVAIYEDPLDATSLVYVRSDKMLEHLEAVWRSAPRDLDYYLRQAAYHQMDARHAVALAAADAAIALGGAAADGRASSARIVALLSLGRVADATEAARGRVAAADNATSRVDLARTLLAANAASDADAELGRALEHDPGDLMALDLRWWPADRNDLQLLQAAIVRLREHAERHSAHAGAWRVLARATAAVGDVDGAMTTFEKAMSLAPQDDELRAEWWTELVKHGRATDVLADAARVTGLPERDWKLRWGEAEALAAAGRKMEAQAAFAAINRDEKLHVDVRKRAKRAAMRVAQGA